MTYITPQRALVVGAGGAIGSAFARALNSRFPLCALTLASRSGAPLTGIPGRSVQLDMLDEASLDTLFAQFERDSLDLVFIATGILHGERDGTSFGPEKATKMLDGHVLAHVLAVNTIGPALVIKHALPKVRRRSPAVLGALSARVGSISDNRLGGWHAYRASKAALNQIIKTTAVETSRTHPALSLVGLHPGTVDSPLSDPFQSHVPEGKLFTPDQSAGYLLDTLLSRSPEHSGRCFAYDGTEIEP